MRLTVFRRPPFEDVYQGTFPSLTSQKHIDMAIVDLGHHSCGGFAHSVKD
jgi:hypothetical protein